MGNEKLGTPGRPDDARDAETMEPGATDTAIRFGGSHVAVAGVFAGMGIALGGPAILLSLGQSLGPVVLTVLVVIALAGGGLVALVSAFFGQVIPSRVHSGPWLDPKQWLMLRGGAAGWHAHGRHSWGWCGDEGNDEDDVPEPAPARTTRPRERRP